MVTLCTLFLPFVEITQQIVNIAFFPLSFLGVSPPTVGTALGGILGCTF